MLSHSEFISALERLFYMAFQRSGGARKVADFLLAWEDANRFGGFDIRDMWGLDEKNKRDIIDVFEYMSFDRQFFDNYGFTPHLFKTIAQWRRGVCDSETLEYFEGEARKVPIKCQFQAPRQVP